ncbi:uncharacterized protein FIBRA_05639 [Fibroporia radiculosa]|uniref:T6SS Phospholipase effector Tle1-like catalytic domain-containing protein n=1 Tax=Fibroporia radiculosa TaxID=599839 RepID=J4GRD5_9APHY|nr:uncharacterized protein FIBRA_05639 [Fibroporia radiculosa]CCM03505.1 predicted protein [Fibroporia radiculosa]
MAGVTLVDGPLPLQAAKAASTFSTSSDGTEMQPRTLVLCFDGTADQYAGQNTNVVKLYSTLKKDDSEQLCYYQPGIGTYVNPGAVSPLFQWGAKVIDQGVAWYLDAHVRGGYQFLMQNYRLGDKICLFGFSRGAYTARALAGMLHKVGLLPRHNYEQIPFAYKLYKRTGAKNAALAAGFKQTFCRAVPIEFVGVWDTVASVGTLISRTLPFIANNTGIKTFRHALALDEHRSKFRPSLYHSPEHFAKSRKNPVKGKAVPRDDENEKVEVKTVPATLGKMRKLLKKRASIQRLSQGAEWGNISEDLAELRWCGRSDTEKDMEKLASGTDVFEVWFAGCHCDIGGSAVPNETKLSLSDITLHWMMRQIAESQCGIVFDHDALVRARIPESVFRGMKGLSISPSLNDTKLHPMDASGSSTRHAGKQASNSTGMDKLDKLNAVEPMHDQLRQIPLWWILEVLPTTYNWQEPSGLWHTSWSIHRGQGRHLPPRPNFHVTVKERMNDKALRYRPKALLGNENSVTYVE